MLKHVNPHRLYVLTTIFLLRIHESLDDNHVGNYVPEEAVDSLECLYSLLCEHALNASQSGAFTLFLLRASKCVNYELNKHMCGNVIRHTLCVCACAKCWIKYVPTYVEG